MTQSVFVKSPIEKRKKLFKSSLLHNHVLFRRRGKVRWIQKAILSISHFIPQPNQFSALVLLEPPPTLCKGTSDLPFSYWKHNPVSHTSPEQLERVTEWKGPGKGWRSFLNVVYPYFVQECRIF